MIPHLEILPKGQRLFWDRNAGLVPKTFVLYGGTAVALRYGHRQSLDFDYFSNQPLDHDALLVVLPALNEAEVLQKRPNELVCRIMVDGGPVKVGFFCDLGIGRVGVPDVIPGHSAIASPLDLLATKLKALHDRIEVKDYLDIEVLLRGGLTLNDGIAAAMALFGASLNAFDTAKAVAWFKDGDLSRKLPAPTRAFLEAATGTFSPDVRPLRTLSRRLDLI